MLKTSLAMQKAVKKYVQTKRGHLCRILSAARARAKRKNLDINLDLDYLESIATDECPVFKTPFVWGRYQKTKGYSKNASLDRIIPELGYIKGNVVFISHRANAIKNNATERELYVVADWLHERTKEVLNAIKKQSTPVSKEYH